MLDLSGVEPVKPGLSGLSCWRCQREFTHFEVSGVTDIPNCPQCNEEIDLSRIILRPTVLGLSLLDDEAARAARWFHLTHRKSWHEAVIEAEVPVHIGSELAAFTRANWIAKRGRRWWLHELQLAKNTDFSPGVEADSTDGEKLLSLEDFEQEFETADAVRYLNIYEDPGNISLLIDPSFVQVVSSTAIEAANIRDHLRRAVAERNELDQQLAQR